MDRVIRIKESDLEFAARLSPEERLRQANAAFRLYHALHDPFSQPILRGFSGFPDFSRFNEEVSLRR